MTAVPELTVAADEDGLRLDRWVRTRFPGATQGLVQKLLRKGNIRVDGARAKAADRLREGQAVRLPPAWLDGRAPPAPRQRSERPVDRKDEQEIRASVIHRDEDLLILNKPPGMAVQGGSRTVRHVDGMLDALRFGHAERPRLVHRLDKDTSGVLVLARSAPSARWLTKAFRNKTVRKLYWAVVVGVPPLEQGEISLPLKKASATKMEKVVSDEAGGQTAITRYRVLDRAGSTAAFLAMEPLTGRTHQLRVHAAQGMGTPILGDGKYGGREAFLDSEGLAKRLHLHARALRIPRPDGSHLEVLAPPPRHMEAALRFLGFDPIKSYDSFLQQ